MTKTKEMPMALRITLLVSAGIAATSIVVIAGVLLFFKGETFPTLANDVSADGLVFFARGKEETWPETKDFAIRSWNLPQLETAYKGEGIFEMAIMRSKTQSGTLAAYVRSKVDDETITVSLGPDIAPEPVPFSESPAGKSFGALARGRDLTALLDLNTLPPPAGDAERVLMAAIDPWETLLIAKGNNGGDIVLMKDAATLPAAPALPSFRRETTFALSLPKAQSGSLSALRKTMATSDNALQNGIEGILGAWLLERTGGQWDFDDIAGFSEEGVQLQVFGSGSLLIEGTVAGSGSDTAAIFASGNHDWEIRTIELEREQTRRDIRMIPSTDEEETEIRNGWTVRTASLGSGSILFATKEQAFALATYADVSVIDALGTSQENFSGYASSEFLREFLQTRLPFLLSPVPSLVSLLGWDVSEGFSWSSDISTDGNVRIRWSSTDR